MSHACSQVLVEQQFEDPGDGNEHWHEGGAVPQLAGLYWRCAWEDVAVKALKAGNLDGYNRAADQVSAWLTILPGLEEFADNFTAIDKQTRAEAERQGISFEELDFSFSCGVYTSERNQ